MAAVALGWNIRAALGVIQGLYGDNGEENENCYLGFRV